MRHPWIFSTLLGSATTLSIYGYQFGRSNHAVYLLDAIRKVDPLLLRYDWFTTHTLQYHVLFSWFAANCIQAGIERSAFAVCYVASVILFHIAARGIVRAIGGNDGAYLLGVALYYISAAGTGLGMYQFFQDSSLLPSNIANVALLFGFWLVAIRKPIAAGACFGIAGAFHLNHALVGSGIWVALGVWRWRKPAVRELLGSLLALAPSAASILMVLMDKLDRSGAMPLSQFIEIYVRLRHPHHYDPSSWPIGIWIAAAWTLVPAIFVLRGELARIWLLIVGLTLVALLGAGLFYVSETLVQMSLYRFSIYLQLFGCLACGVMMERWLAKREPLNRKRMASVLAGGCACVLLAGVGLVRGPFFGIFVMPGDNAAYVALCEWVSRNTSVDAVFVVPPDEESMRIIGRRAIVVNFKGVPQLSAELLEWQKRLCDVTGIQSLDELPRGYPNTMRALRERYEQLNVEQLTGIAAEYGADYIVARDSAGDYSLLDRTGKRVAQ